MTIYWNYSIEKDKRMKATSSIMASGLIIMAGIAPTATDVLIQTHKNDTQVVRDAVQQKNYGKEYSQLCDKLYSYRDLKNNWDGYGGVRPKDEIIFTTEKFIKSLESSSIMPPRIMVAGSGQVALFWKNKGNYIEIDFDEEGYYSYFSKLNGKVKGYDEVAVSGYIPKDLYVSIEALNANLSTERASAKSLIKADIIKTTSSSFFTAA